MSAPEGSGVSSLRHEVPKTSRSYTSRKTIHLPVASAMPRLRAAEAPLSGPVSICRRGSKGRPIPMESSVEPMSTTTRSGGTPCCLSAPLIVEPSVAVALKHGITIEKKPCGLLCFVRVISKITGNWFKPKRRPSPKIGLLNSNLSPIGAPRESWLERGALPGDAPYTSGGQRLGGLIRASINEAILPPNMALLARFHST